MEELKECPFCGSDEVRIKDDPNGSVFISCGKCFPSTGKFSMGNEKLAIKAWNIRTSEPKK